MEQNNAPYKEIKKEIFRIARGKIGGGYERRDLSVPRH